MIRRYLLLAALLSSPVLLAMSAAAQPMPAEGPAASRTVHDYYVVTMCSLTGEGCHNEFYTIPPGVSQIEEGINAALIKAKVGKTVTDDGSVWQIGDVDFLTSEIAPKGATPLPPTLWLLHPSAEGAAACAKMEACRNAKDTSRLSQ